MNVYFLANLLASGWNPIGITVAGLNCTPNTTDRTLHQPQWITVDAEKTLYIADTFNHRIQQWKANDTKGTTVAGQSNGSEGYGLDSLCYPSAVLVDSIGNLYVNDPGNNRVLLFKNSSRNGTIIAGNGKT